MTKTVQFVSVGENTNKCDTNVAERTGSQVRTKSCAISTIDYLYFQAQMHLFLPQRDAEVTYAAPSFNKVKTKKSRSRTVTAEEHVVYSDVRRGN